MNQIIMDKEKKQLDAWIDKFVGRFPRNVPIIEHKPQNFPLMLLPQEYKEDQTEEVTS